MNTRTATLTLLACLILLAMASSADAQRNNDGSVYSQLGIGTLEPSLSSQARAMGRAETALLSANYLPFSNPGTWSAQLLTRFTGSFNYQNVQFRNAAGESGQLSTSQLGPASFSFPVYQNRLGFAAVYAPFSRIGYRVRESGVVRGDSTQYTSAFSGDGGLQSIRFGLGYRVTGNVRIGASFDLVTGILQRERSVTFPNGSGFAEAPITQETRMRGYTATIGTITSFSDVVREEDILRLAASARLPVSLEGTRVNTVGRTLDRDTLGTASDGQTRLPAELRLGLSYRPNEYVHFSADGLYAPWSRFESDFAFQGYRPNGSSRFTDRWKTGGGLEWRPAGSDQNADYLARTAYRVGGFVDRQYVRPVAGIDLTTYGVTAGLSLPTAMPSNRLDVSLEMGTRGSTGQGLVRDFYYDVSLVLNFGERWFMERALQ